MVVVVVVLRRWWLLVVGVLLGLVRRVVSYSAMVVPQCKGCGGVGGCDGCSVKAVVATEGGGGGGLLGLIYEVLIIFGDGIVLRLVSDDGMYFCC